MKSAIQFFTQHILSFKNNCSPIGCVVSDNTRDQQNTISHSYILYIDTPCFREETSPMRKTPEETQNIIIGEDRSIKGTIIIIKNKRARDVRILRCSLMLI